MATSGTIKARYLNALVGDIYAELTWERTGYSIPNNTSTIKWELKIVSYGEIVIAPLNENYTVGINGTKYTGEAGTSVGANGTRILASGTETISHNANGTKSFPYSFTLTCKNVDWKDISASDIGELDTILRHATITSAPDFNDEENPTITYFNPAGEATTTLQAAIYLTNGETALVPYKNLVKTDASFTFSLTDAERTALRNAVTIGNKVDVRFYVTSTVNGKTEYSFLTKTLSLVNYEPTLSPTVAATDARTKELTGDSSGKTLIRYISDVSFNTGSAARKGAAIEYHTIRNGVNILDDYTSKTGTMTGVNSNTFYFSATDSRGITTNDFVAFSQDNGKYIPYIYPSNRIDSTSLVGSGVLTVKISGQYYNGSFGAVNNTMDIDYRIVDEDGNVLTETSDEYGNTKEYARITNITPDMDGNQYSYEFTVSGLDHEKQYTIELYVVDEITNASSSSKVIASIPVFDWSRTDFAHHTDIYMDAGKKIMSKDTNGTERQILWQGSDNGSVQLGYGNYEGADGDTRIYGNKLYFYANDDNISINGNALADFVISEGTSGTWYYRKWKSGRCELYGYQNISNYVCTTAMGNMYRTIVINAPSFPFTVNSPKMVASYESEGYGAFFWATTLTTTTKPSNYYLVRPTSSNSITGKVHFHVQGSWK